MTKNITQDDALRRFPELVHLLSIREAGWNFHLLGENDELVGVAASYSRAQFTDAIFVFDRTHFLANRLLADDYGGGVVWMKESSDLEEIVHDIRDLPAPGEPGAPSLVLASGSLWTP
ncbi:hypothetical protein [Actinokineospora globicatena]|uniref:hypothetical protein n=1 Tax=Actinokineospora globicatena TaxID=103729 RepID=UPI0020A45B55|nr:hypothetical protein [Actinokineospora globicatena]MCP2304023.1 hypothetical protein [Actinokineospora globicatena]GLW78627.1 hypothetical protein Aglo01_31090 [Actinokineospora globicatena]GLW84705.1 hypothetical protein Aglo02_23450 [Actinokineospora globicatena]